ncbi:MAG: hypothetical protein KJP05_01260, partial [Deltaproteobacteria bacterium]|nr:hypothetical protein [Deltaproteobacteria bacterium]
MDFLEITRYGNTVEDYLISAAIVVASLFVSRWMYAILRRTVCEWVFAIQDVLEKQNLHRLSNLTTVLIPIAAFYVAKNRLTIGEEVSAWLNIAVVISGQIAFLLIVSSILEPLAEVLIIKSMKSVEGRETKFLQAQKEAIEKVRKHIRGLTGVFLLLIPGLTLLSSVMPAPTIWAVPPSVMPPIITIWVVPLVLALIDFSLCLRIILVTKRRLRKKKSVRAAPEAPASREAVPLMDDPDLEVKESIVNFFLNVYKHRLRALPNSPAEFRLVDSQSFAPNCIYELRVMTGDDWQSRRMTIGPIGEDTGSRSKCFYVIYDHHLVIKIPPNPISDLSRYLEILKNERRIAEQLAMKECIIPTASVVLKLIQRISDKADLSPEEREGDYMKLLSIFSELQKYLRIGNTFAFFMDLSKYYFLGHIIQSFHDVEKRVHDEISRQAEVVGDFLKFEDRYGRQNIPAFLETEKLYARYESEIKKLAKQFKMSSSLPQNQTKKWFLTHLVGNRVTEVEKGFDAQFIIELNRLIDSLISENYAAIKSCRENISKSIHESAFTRNKAYMEGIITNLLELLAHLKLTGVAMRDLKPDNLLVAGNKEKYPSFLAYPKEYKIGLIDVETAVIYSSSGARALHQPPLGGTPQYATVSHLFTNLQLKHFYKNLSMILHLQDWYAVVAMIYRTITGLPLFEKTARILPTMISAIRELGAEKVEQFHNVNQVFWSSSVSEFKEKIKKRKQRLGTLNISILDQARKMFKESASSEKREIAEEMQHCLSSSNIQLSDKDQKFLLSCSYENTIQLRKKWENRTETQATQKLENFHIISLLQELEELKLPLETQEEMLRLLDDSEPQIPADAL